MGKLRLPEALASWSPGAVSLARAEVGRAGSALGPVLPLAWTLSLYILAKKCLSFSLASLFLRLLRRCFSVAEEAGKQSWVPAPFLPTPQHLGWACAVAAALQVSRSWSCHSRSQGPGDSNGSLLVGCSLPAACQPVPLHTADNHVRRGDPSCPWCDLNLNFGLLSSPREARFR